MIQKFYQILSNYFKPHSKKNLKNDQEYIASLSFYMTKNKDIDIVCKSPDLADVSLENIDVLSETFAEFLSYINDGYLREDILTILDNKHKSLTEAQQAKYKLFFDNVVFHWAMIYTKKLQYKKQLKKANQPLVRPSSVFNIS